MHECVWWTNKCHLFVGFHGDDDGCDADKGMWFYPFVGSQEDYDDDEDGKGLMRHLVRQTNCYQLPSPLIISQTSHPSLCISHTFKEEMINDAKKRKLSSNEDGKGCKIEFLTDTYCECTIIVHVQAVLLYSVKEMKQWICILRCNPCPGALLLQNLFIATKLVCAISKLSCIYAKSTNNGKWKIVKESTIGWSVFF